MKEDIEKAAEDYANENIRYPGEISYESDIEEMMKCFADAFKAGSNYRINHAWHKAEERPERKRNYIAQCKGGRFIVIPDSMNWDNFYRREEIIRWAYIEDLLPNTED